MISKPLRNEFPLALLPQTSLFPFIFVLTVYKLRKLKKTGFIYTNIRYYRLVMSLLYKGDYYRRFHPVSKLISGKTVTEICFGDTIIAEYCRKNGIRWTGIDINPVFIDNALKKGFNAVRQDALSSPFPPADICIICGSLYHFHEDAEKIISKMLACAPLVIISEPVINLSDNKGIIGKLAKASANINGKEHAFRYTKKTLTALLDDLAEKLGFQYQITEQFNKDLILVLKR
jgi:methyltransferase family protein